MLDRDIHASRSHLSLDVFHIILVFVNRCVDQQHFAPGCNQHCILGVASRKRFILVDMLQNMLRPSASGVLGAVRIKGSAQWLRCNDSASACTCSHSGKGASSRSFMLVGGWTCTVLLFFGRITRQGSSKVLHLLSTARINQAWFQLSVIVQLVVSLGFHRIRRTQTAH